MFRLNDSMKKVAIIGSTAVLPESLRVAARERLLGRLEVSIARRSRLIIIAHPKCGNTWLKVMLTRLYANREGVSEEAFARYNLLADSNPRIPRIAATNGWYSYEGEVGKLLLPDGTDTPLKHKPVVLLARNPADIAVSWYFQFTRRQSRHKQELINHFIAHPIDRKRIEMWDFVRHSDIGLPFLIEFLNTWEQRVSKLEKGMLIHYEDLRTRPGEVLDRVTRLMGDAFTPEEIQAAVEYGSFDNLRQLEAEGFFRQGGLTLRNAKDPESFKVRRAKIGGYRDYFDDEQVAEIEALMAERLSPTLGYT
ncbi:MAG TPA: hypothetical protein ENK50_10640, partial [Sedimenticola sp.]|nr:hypothetical protein [Sedimenticola sp.]